MATNRVKVQLRGKTRLLSPRALEIAQKHFGAVRKSADLARDVPVELLKIPVKVIQKPVLNIPPLPEVKPPEAKVIVPPEPEVKAIPPDKTPLEVHVKPPVVKKNFAKSKGKKK